jgi:hypothetical protein
MDPLEELTSQLEPFNNCHKDNCHKDNCHKDNCHKDNCHKDNCHKDNCHKDNCLDIVCVGEEWHRRQRLRLFCRNRRKMELLIHLFAYNIDGGLNEWVLTVNETFPWYEKYGGSFCFLRKRYGVHNWTM